MWKKIKALLEKDAQLKKRVEDLEVRNDLLEERISKLESFLDEAGAFDITYDLDEDLREELQFDSITPNLFGSKNNDPN